MKKSVTKIVLLITALVLALALAVGCGADKGSGSAKGSGADSGDANQRAADRVQGLIESIQDQVWTTETEDLCLEAKAAWDALTDKQKELVEDADYFALDTGDASLDDPLNQDEIGEKEILVVSFGTSYNDSRVQDIGAIEKAIAAAYPDWAVRRAFSAQIIINHIFARDGEKIDNVEQALTRAEENGVKNLIVQPTLLMHGAEYDELAEAVEAHRANFESVAVAEPLLGEVGADGTVVNADKEAVAKAVVETAFEGIGGQAAAAADGTALVLLGHGTSHQAAVTYDQMQTQVELLAYNNVFVGTVEGEPEDTEVSEVIEKVKAAGFKKVILRPLMVVAGDHANNDMADLEDPESWISMFSASNAFDGIEADIAGLGRIPAIEAIYVAHTQAVMNP